MKNVLVFTAGSEIGLEIHNALKYSTHFRIFGLTSAENHSEYVFADCLRISEFYGDPGFLETLNKLIERYEIDYIYPAGDGVQLYLMQNQDRISAAVVSADLATTELCRFKRKTYRLFEGESFIPKTYDSPEEVREYPVFLKPDIGQGSQGVKIVNNRKELEFGLWEMPQRMICEYLPGEEYTVDCFTDCGGRLIDIKMRNRKRIRTGISVHSELLPLDPEAECIAQTLNSRLNFLGAWFFQVKRDADGRLKLMEVSPRIAGTMGLTRNTGTNYPLLTLFTFMGQDVSLIRNHYQITVDRAFINRYRTDIQYDTVYLDFDDTLVVRNRVNGFLMMFLYQAKDAGKRIVLLSRHRNDIDESLKRCHVDGGLFDEVHILGPSEKKSDYITETKSVFIDDSFGERQEVSAIRGIPVFDCSEVEALVDWRL